MTQITYSSDRTKSTETMQGSDGRANVSSRQDSRGAYNSRDASLSFNLLWDDASSEAGDFILYIKNTDTTGKAMVVSTIGCNSAQTSSFKLHRVSGIAAAGTTVTPFCSNQVTPKVSQSVAMEAAGTPITGLTSLGIFDHVASAATSHGEMLLDDRVRIGQDQAVAIEYEQGTTGRTWGRISVYFE